MSSETRLRKHLAVDSATDSSFHSCIGENGDGQAAHICKATDSAPCIALHPCGSVCLHLLAPALRRFIALLFFHGRFFPMGSVSAGWTSSPLRLEAGRHFFRTFFWSWKEEPCQKGRFFDICLSRILTEHWVPDVRHLIHFFASYCWSSDMWVSYAN